MTRDDLAETILGFAVVVVAAVFLVFAAQRGGVGATAGGYAIHAAFPNVDGVSAGSEVRLSGVKVGTVTDVRLLPDKDNWVRVDIAVRADVKIPTDSTARIASGLLGGAHVALESGGSKDQLAAGGEIMNTQGAIDPLSLLAAFSGGGEAQGGGQ